jgi:hypothetical protein
MESNVYHDNDEQYAQRIVQCPGLAIFSETREALVDK